MFCNIYYINKNNFVISNNFYFLYLIIINIFIKKSKIKYLTFINLFYLTL